MAAYYNLEDQVNQSSQEIVNIGKRMVESGLVIGTWGNISAFMPEEELVIITPSGMDYESLTIADLVITNLKGEVKRGERKPSSELDLHLEVYRNRKDVKAVIHTHSNYATAAAVSRVDIPPLTEDMVQLLGGGIKVANYAPAGSEELAINALRALSNNNAVLLANHGVVGVGRSLHEAMTVCQMAEKGAQLFIYSKLLGSPHAICEEDVREMREYYLSKYGQK